MIKLIVGIIIILLVAGVYLWLRKKRINKVNSGLEKILGDSDYQRLIITSPQKCLECGACMLDSKGCCSACVNSVKTFESESTDTHCHEHNHDHKHHNRSNQGGEKGLLSLVIMPLIGGIFIYQIIRKVWKIKKL